MLLRMCCLVPQSPYSVFILALTNAKWVRPGYEETARTQNNKGNNASISSGSKLSINSTCQGGCISRGRKVYNVIRWKQGTGVNGVVW